MELLLDVFLDAPIVVLPLNSGSPDHMEVDLGTLLVNNRIVWEARGGAAGGGAARKVLLDDMRVRGGCTGGGSKRGSGDRGGLLLEGSVSWSVGWSACLPACLPSGWLGWGVRGRAVVPPSSRPRPALIL